MSARPPESPVPAPESDASSSTEAMAESASASSSIEAMAESASAPSSIEAMAESASAPSSAGAMVEAASGSSSAGTARGASGGTTSDAAEEEARKERNREVLRARARALAVPLVRAVAEEEVELLLFRVGGERFAVESRYVCEVFSLTELAPIPGGRPPLAGITGWRGDLLTLFDLRHLSAGPARPLADLGRVVVLGDEVPAFGVLADAVDGLERRGTAAIHPPPDGVARGWGLLRGVTDDAVRVLDGAALLRELH